MILHGAGLDPLVSSLFWCILSCVEICMTWSTILQVLCARNTVIICLISLTGFFMVLITTASQHLTWTPERQGRIISLSILQMRNWDKEIKSLLWRHAKGLQQSWEQKPDLLALNSVTRVLSSLKPMGVLYAEGFVWSGPCLVIFYFYCAPVQEVFTAQL